MTILAATSGADLAVAFGTCGAFGTSLFVAIYAVRQFGAARRLREDQARPYVYVDFEVDERQMIFITVKNGGKTGASDVSFKCEPALRSSRDDPSVEGRSLPSGFLDQGWAHLPPGKVITSWFDTSPHHAAAKLPDRYEVTANYKAPALKNRALGPETFVLDLSSYRGRWNQSPKALPELVDVAKEMVQEFKGWSGSKPLGLVGQDRHQYEQETAQQHAIWLADIEQLAQQDEGGSPSTE